MSFQNIRDNFGSPLQYLHGLRREDMEDIALEALKWQCAICLFHNPEDRDCCGLCDTKRGTEVALVDMNTKQKCARARKQWQRRVDPLDGNIYWQQASNPVHNGPHYLIRPTATNATSPTTNDDSNLLHLERLTAHSGAGVAISGTVLPSWWLSQLDDLTAQSFSLKYAWLLTQIAHGYKNYSKMQVYRDKIFDESLEILMLLRPDHLCAMTRIELLGESGIDAGGVLREWYSLLTLSLFEPERGLFIPANKAEQAYFINPSSGVDHGPDHLRRFQAIGRMLGSAIVDGQVLPFHLCTPLFKALLGSPLAFEDVWHLDLNTYNSLVYIRQTDNVADLALDFSVTLDKSHDVVDLVPNGRNIPVTRENQDEYVERMVSYLLFDRIQPQLTALVRGLYEVVPAELLMPFDHKELELLVCGHSHIDVADWRASTSVSVALKTSKCIKWFWDIVEHELSDADRAKLLRFATGSSRVPLQGFKGLTSYDGKLCPFSLKAVPYSRGIFPKAHSCFNRIDLPIYPTRELLKEAVLALVNLETTEFTLE
ncbi:hypothetical protein, variant [Aphanomyces invadans]|uniref:HECT-type E3 ubiquitin transferase n=1 Tax=Aphanomyces invadans TaxID=157072 RepID=A0A024UHX1_9STRA|nr:hypothetical protein, variant [Aphanomyces invadans]ETW05879.1 hypothetical protein, variant [Aphanomyces invadans]|eukprot:XP_008865656.1 hypothetical protein, variant [Aphanomyces invadans]